MASIPRVAATRLVRAISANRGRAAATLVRSGRGLKVVTLSHQQHEDGRGNGERDDGATAQRVADEGNGQKGHPQKATSVAGRVGAPVPT